jgi:hypothetical protein
MLGFAFFLSCFFLWVVRVRAREVERSQSRGNEGITHCSRYVTVKKESGKVLFYWLCGVIENTLHKPLVLYLT